jgi:glycosyltransferase involved in cell wall biosynthesis
MNPTLTILLSTINGREKLKKVLPGLRSLGHELIVCVDDSTVDDSQTVAREYADRVLQIPHGCFLPGSKAYRLHGLEVVLPHCNSDWILRLDHDETLGPGWENRDRVIELLSDRFATSYWIPRRWAVPPGDRYISSDHWYPDFQMRLFRNIPSLLHLESELHAPTRILGEPRFLTNEWIVHWDLVWHARKTREAKVHFYSTLGSYTGREFYLYEEQEYETQPLDYMPPDSAFGSGHCTGGNPLACRIQALDVPRMMRNSCRHHVLVAIRNLSSRTFHPASAGVYRGNVRVSYHWYTYDSGQWVVHSWDHERTDLPGRLLPGQSAAMYLPVSDLPPPGTYWLQPDLVEEGVAWASNFTDELPAYKIDVVVPSPREPQRAVPDLECSRTLT